MRPKRPLILISASAITFACAALLLYLHIAILPPRPVAISPETTLITVPLTPAGTVDYVTFINGQLSKGVTPENNALVALLPAIGSGKNTLGKAHAQILSQIGGDESPGCWHEQPHELRFNVNPEVEYTPFLLTEHPDISAWLDTNQHALDLIAAALRRNHFWFPLVPLKPDRSLSSVEVLDGFHDHLRRQIFEAFQWRAMRSLGAGDIGAAWRDLLTSHRFTHLLAQEPLLVNFLIPCAYDTRVQRADLVLLNRQQLPAGFLRQMLADLQSLPPLPKMTEALHRWEIYQFPDAVQHAAIASALKLNAQPVRSSRLPIGTACSAKATPFSPTTMLRPPGPRPNKRLAWIQSIRLAIKERSDRAFADCRHSDIGNFNQRLFESCNAFTRRLSDHLLSIVTPEVSFDDTHLKNFELVLLACALELHRAEHGRYPDTLAELAPLYVPTIPLDYYNRPLTYSHTDTSFKLLSTGPGTTDPAAAEKANVCIKVEVHHPQ